MSIPCSLTYQDHTIEFTLRTSARKTLEIAVQPSQQVIVSAPKTIRQEDIDQFVLQRANWILKQIEYFKAHIPSKPGPIFKSGEKHLYLGELHTLDIARGLRPEIYCRNHTLLMLSPKPKCSKTNQRILTQWYRQQAKIIFASRLTLCMLPFVTLNIPKPSIQIRKLKRRWGSMNTRAEMTLNYDLVRAPFEHIDYVITHELCHLKHMNHSPAFYRLLDKMMPNWQSCERGLEHLIGGSEHSLTPELN